MVDLRDEAERFIQDWEQSHEAAAAAQGDIHGLSAPAFTQQELYSLISGWSPGEQQGLRQGEPLPIKSILDLKPPPPHDDPDELLQRRFLCRAGVALLVGPTGIGKSSFILQAAIQWALGREHFGIRPARPLTSAIIQAENDEGDMAEMCNGVFCGMGLGEAEIESLRERVFTLHENGGSGEQFIARAEQVRRALPELDLLFIDPAFAYLGGDALAAKDVTHFMRHLLMPLAERHRIGVIIVHHTNKPLAGKEKNGWTAGDFAYLGAGSAEWVNAARGCLAIRSIGSETAFELLAPKRGRRLGWVDQDGAPTTKRYIAHERQPGMICWRDADPGEVAGLTADSKEAQSIREEANLVKLVEILGDGIMPRSQVAARLKSEMNYSKRTAYARIKDAVDAGILEPLDDDPAKPGLRSKGDYLRMVRPGQ